MIKLFSDDNSEETTINIYLWTLLARARDAIHKARQGSLKKFGITPEQFLILILIKEITDSGGKPTPSEIARRTFRNTNTISVNTNRMVSKGLVNRKKDKKNKKITVLFLTHEGENIYEFVRNKEVTTRIMSSLTQEQSRQLISCMNTIMTAAVHEIGKGEYEKIIKSMNVVSPKN
jgi:DNA-binding MarR family transcriptional regulator